MVILVSLHLSLQNITECESEVMLLTFSLTFFSSALSLRVAEQTGLLAARYSIRFSMKDNFR